MKRHLLAIVICASTLALLAQQPKVTNTQFTVEPLGGKLTVAVDRFRQSSEQLWLGYEVAALPQSHLSTCSNWSDTSQMDDGCCGEYRLEENDHSMSSGDRAPVPQNIYILFRLDHGQIIRVRPVMAGCHLDAGGVPFTWLTGVNPDESVAFLAQLATQSSQSDHSKIIDGALLSISYHETPEATHALSQIALSTASMHVREQAAFWLGVQRGHEGFVALQALEKQTTETAFREKLPFDFSQNSDPEAQDELLRMAKSDANPKVREQALFWLAQKAGKKASAAITDAIQNDPETDVKKKAVFALSQLPKDEGVPQLIHVADTNPNPVIRKEAFFWLGQSQDARALAYLEQVLKR
ncbi:HEAT repeat domain-containing protein [Alloacidobacterium dinghuense]|uniref:HEAT repeat domain-containing protein n=1 Tax=Alloacidobacterium dinghuense TaxID=2763107 RepID=A0A7G8BED7_9BACT|nr:HEAT repeat domain-containing protein [Alloacidobacterium dinghuense]QNI30907.1 HEAT repeat domain-containing protein [Alloacidobacterium dinghuense]